MEQEGRYTVYIGEKDEGRVLRNYLKSTLHLSQARLSSVKFDPEGILLNGDPCHVGTILHAGDVLSVRLMDSVNRQLRLVPCEMPLEILYEDENLIAINKPAGVVCHPSKGHVTDSLASGLAYYFNKTQPDARVHLLGRLDKDTSGIVLCAKNGFTADRLKDNISKVYVALAEGYFSKAADCVTCPMKEVRDPESGILKMTAAEDGKKAVTEYQVISQMAGYALLRVTLLTGRTHQIRFHMAEAGHPLLGDSLYGNASELIERTALHAGKLTFIHPFTQEKVHVEAEIPEDMKRLAEGIPDSLSEHILRLPERRE